MVLEVAALSPFLEGEWNIPNTTQAKADRIP